MKKFFNKLRARIPEIRPGQVGKQKARWPERFSRIFRRWGLAKRLEHRRIREK